MKSLAALLALVALPALAQERWDHKNSLGLTVAGGGEVRTAIITTGVTDQGLRANVDVGGTWGFGIKWSALLAGRMTFGGPLGLAVLGGVRNAWGQQFKTFFDFTVIVHVLPNVTIGPRFAFGAQYELNQLFGLFALAAAQFGGGQGLRIGGEVMAGFQVRSYVFD